MRKKSDNAAANTGGSAPLRPTSKVALPRPRRKLASAPRPPRTEDWMDFVLGVPLPDDAIMEPDGGFWVFAYGSLIWDPGFPVAEAHQARLPGFRRSFCLWSVHYRGTAERPGLVMGLEEDPQAETRGLALRVAPEHAAETRRYIIERELVSGAYLEVAPSLELLCSESGRVLDQRNAVTYKIDAGHAQYAQGLTLDEQSAVIASSAGPKGPNYEYLFNTVAQLRQQGLSEDELGELSQLEASVRALLAEDEEAG